MAYELQKAYLPLGTWGLAIKLFTRFLQIILGITIAGIYGHDIQTAAKNGSSADRDWVYGVVVGGSSAVVACVYMLPFLKAFALFWLDGVIVIMHAALVGIFGRAYLGKNGEDARKAATSGTDFLGPNPFTMRNAVYLSMFNGGLWLLTAGFGLFILLRVSWLRKNMDRQAYESSNRRQRMSAVLTPWGPNEGFGKL